MWWVSSGLVLSATVTLSAQVVTYDGTVFPEETGDGWTHIDVVNQAERWIENGWLFESSVLLPCPPDCFTQDFYRRELADQAGAAAWSLSWRMETDGPLSIGAVAPSGIVAGGNSAAFYHFTIGHEQVAFFRDAFIPLVVVEIDPGAHIFRLQLDNTVDPPTYEFTIDGVIADAGEALGPYPTDDSAIVFGASAAIVDSVTRWDFIEFGPLPGDPIPAVSTWGVVVLTLAVVTGGTVLFRRRDDTRRLGYVCTGRG